MDIISSQWRWFRQARRRWMALVSAIGWIATVVAIGFGTSAAGAVTIAGTFELDGNIADTPATPAAAPWDWSTFFDSSGNRITPLPTGFTDSGFKADYEFPDKSTFTGGSKDTLDTSKWACTDSNNLGGKFDIINAYSTIYKVPSSGNGLTEGDQLLFFGIERSATEGDGNMGFWFLKDGSVNCEKTSGGKAPAFSGNHSDGDIFVVAGFSNGGTNASVTAYEWSGGATGSLDTTPFVTSTQVCGTAGVIDACGIVNTSTIDPPWEAPDKNGGDLDINAFYEGFVRVPVNLSSGCFATFVANTRSSTSTTATIMDFSRGSFPTCRPATTLSSNTSATTVHAGDSVTWTVTETNSGNSPIRSVTVTDTASSPCTFVRQSGDTDNDNVLDPATTSTAAEAWVYTCTKTITATTTLSAFASGIDNTTNKNVTADPSKCTFSGTPPTGTPKTGYESNTICDPNERASTTVTVIAPSTTLQNTAATASPSPVRAGDDVKFTFYEKNDSATEVLGTPTLVEETTTGCSPAQVKKVEDPTTSVIESDYNFGDTGNDGIFGPGEEWKFECTTSFPTGSSSGTVTMRGHALDSLGADVTYYTGTGGAACTAGAIQTGTPPKLCDLEERTSATVTVINPSTILREDVTASVTFKYYEKNSGDSIITSPSVSSTCTGGAGTSATAVTTTFNGLTYNAGDSDHDGNFDPLEVWEYSCTRSLSIPAADASLTYSDSSEGHGTDAAGHAVGSTNETDTSSATITRGKLASSIP